MTPQSIYRLLRTEGRTDGIKHHNISAVHCVHLADIIDQTTPSARKPKLKPTDVNSVEGISEKRSFAHVVVLVVDLEPPHAASEATRRSGLW